MKAAVFHGPRDIRIENVPDPKLEPESILVKVKACGVCGTDLHIYKLEKRPGIIFGHEFSGDVVKVGAKVKDIKEGERVTGFAFRPCGQCHWCKQGQFNRCSSMAVMGDTLPGALAEYVLIPFATPGRTVFRLPDTFSYEDGALVEPLAIAVRAVRRAQRQNENTIVVLGAGFIGLGIIQLLKSMGVAKVIASGRRARRLAMAKESGADLVIDAAKTDPLAAVREATNSLWADIAFDCAGSPATFQQAIDMVQNGGKVILVGEYEQPVTWNPTIVVNKSLSLIGTWAGHFPGAIEFLQIGQAKVRPLITHRFPLDHAKEAFETQLNAPEAIKVLVTM